MEESKEALQRQKDATATATSDGNSTSSFSSYDTADAKGKFKCRACLQGFMSKKLLEKHRKTPEHKIREKKYREDHAK